MTQVRDDELPRGARTGAPHVEPRLAASVILLRGAPYEVLLLRRHEASSFVPGAWVFPGGTVDAVDHEVGARLGDGSDLATMRACATRELFEESGIWLGEALDAPEAIRTALLEEPSRFRSVADASRPALESLVWTSRWITPRGVPKRFDTWFFLAEVPRETSATPEHQEGVEVLWITPDQAMSQHRRGDFPLVFPTIRNLEAITGHTSSGALIASRRDITITPVEPVLLVDANGRKRIVLPGEV